MAAIIANLRHRWLQSFALSNKTPSPSHFPAKCLRGSPQKMRQIINQERFFVKARLASCVISESVKLMEAAMSRLTIYLGRLIGLFLLVMSLSMALDKTSLVEIVTALFDDRALLLILGMMALAAGLAIVLGHNVWSGGLLPVLVTLFGWLLVIRGLVLLLVPSETLIAYFQFLRFYDLFYAYAGITFLLGLIFAYAAFSARADYSN